jgi:hypothetical protein
MQGTVWADKILEKKIDGFHGRLRCRVVFVILVGSILTSLSWGCSDC